MFGPGRGQFYSLRGVELYTEACAVCVEAQVLQFGGHVSEACEGSGRSPIHVGVFHQVAPRGRPPPPPIYFGAFPAYVHQYSSFVDVCSPGLDPSWTEMSMHYKADFEKREHRLIHMWDTHAGGCANAQSTEAMHAPRHVHDTLLAAQGPASLASMHRARTPAHLHTLKRCPGARRGVLCTFVCGLSWSFVRSHSSPMHSSSLQLTLNMCCVAELKP